MRLALSAPGTSWAAAAALGRGGRRVASTAARASRSSLFRGATPFVYAGFIGPTTTGSHDVSITVDDPPLGHRRLAVRSRCTTPALEVVDPDPTRRTWPTRTRRSCTAGRRRRSTTRRSSTTPARRPPAAGPVRLSYTIVWSHEDAGTGFVPFLLGGSWGRFTDIENAMSFTVARRRFGERRQLPVGRRSRPTTPTRRARSARPTWPFTGSYWGHHPILRDATGNNDFSDQGTTAFRFQQAPGRPARAGPAPRGGHGRQPVDLSGDGRGDGPLVHRLSLDPRSPQPGDARQYGYVQLAATGSGVTSVSVDVQLSGSTTWYQGDLGSGYPLHGVGQVRTVVKLPADWESHPVTGVRVRVFPASAAASVQVQSLSVEGLDADWTLSTRPLPTPSVVGAMVDDPVAVGLQVMSGGAQLRPPGAAVSPFVVRVTDSLDEPLEGVPVTFARTSGPALTFVSCSCATVDAVSDAGGVAASGPSTAPAQTGTVAVDAGTVDPLTPPAAFQVVVALPPPTTTTTETPDLDDVDRRRRRPRPRRWSRRWLSRSRSRPA